MTAVLLEGASNTARATLPAWSRRRLLAALEQAQFSVEISETRFSLAGNRDELWRPPGDEGVHQQPDP